MRYPKVRLNREGTAKVLRGELWLSREDILEPKSYLEKIPKGSPVTLQSKEGYFLAQGYINLDVRYCIKVLTRAEVAIDKNFFANIFSRALRLRRSIYPGEEAFRLLFAEGDFVPGLADQSIR